MHRNTTTVIQCFFFTMRKNATRAMQFLSYDAEKYHKCNIFFPTLDTTFFTIFFLRCIEMVL